MGKKHAGKKSAKVAKTATTKTAKAAKKAVKKAVKKKAVKKKAVKKKAVKKKAAKKASAKKASAKKASAKKAVKKKAVKKKAVKAKASPSPAAAAEPNPTATTTARAVDGVQWLAAERDYQVALVEGALVCQNPKGRPLASVPKWLKDSSLGQELLELRDWLKQHTADCLERVEHWMLRSLPVPASVLASVWPDPAWRELLTNLVVGPSIGGALSQDEAGFLRAVEPDKGVGIVDLDGETQWLDSELVMIPHPILLEELSDFRELSVELKLTQQADQLFRQTWEKPAEFPNKFAMEDYAGGKFEQLNFALGHCRRLGVRVRGGNACCPVWENGRMLEARFWIGAEYPEGETWTGSLGWVDDRETAAPLAVVGPVAYSEGVRMAAAIYAKRQVETDDE